jgi:GxxExxY protein
MGIQRNAADELTARILYCVIRVHQILGPGFLENIYRRALVIELKRQNLYFECEKQITIYYEGQEVGIHRLDLVIENKVILELKTVESLSKAHYSQLRSYLKATGLKTGLLINFSSEKADIRRLDV